MAMRTQIALPFLMLAALGGSAAAAPPNRIHGTIETLAGNVLSVKTSDGQIVAIELPSNVSVTALANRKLTDIKAGDYVGSAAVQAADGKLHAEEIHIFAEAMRGAGEGHRPMDGPRQSMTNATVQTVASDPQGEVLKLTYPGGEQDIEIDPTTRIVAIIPGDRSLLKAGALVSVFVNRQADGKVTARGIQAEKDGVPPL